MAERLDPVLPEVGSATQDAFGTLAQRERADDRKATEGRGPWALAWRRLRRNKIALAAGAVFVLIVVICLAAPLWADQVAHTGPRTNHLTEQIVVDGKRTDVVSPDGVPIGPTFEGRFFLGADANGRDTAVRLLYGGRNSLIIGIGAALITTLLSIIVGTVAGYFGGWVDTASSWGAAANA